MAVTNDTLSAQIKAAGELSAERDGAIQAKMDDFIGVQRTCNEAQHKHNEAIAMRVGENEAEHARLDERVSHLRNAFAAVQGVSTIISTTIAAWLGTR